MDANSATSSSDSFDIDAELDTFIGEPDGNRHPYTDNGLVPALTARLNHRNNDSACITPVTGNREQVIPPRSADGGDPEVLRLKQKLGLLRRRMSTARRNHQQILGGLQADLECKLDSMRRIHAEELGTFQAAYEARIKELQFQLEEQTVALRSAELVVSRLSSHQDKLLKELGETKETLAEKEKYIVQLEGRLREFRVPTPSKDFGYALLSSLHSRD